MLHPSFFTKYLVITIYLVNVHHLYAQSSFGAVDLKTEYLQDPIGIDVVKPRLSWRLNDNRQGAKQTAYQVSVDTDSIEVVKGKGSVWNAGWINGDNGRVTFNGAALQPFTKYFWRVDIVGKDKRKLTAVKVSGFETGRMDSKN